MATGRIFAYNSSGTPPAGADQFGNIAVHNNFSGGGGLQWWMGPDEDLGYVLAGTESGFRTGGNALLSVNSPFVKFWRTSSKTDQLFLDLVARQTGQIFASASVAKTWLESNGYWTSWVDTYKFSSGVLLSWPNSTAGYTVYNGGFSFIDDGYSNSSITLPTQFELNNQSSNQLYMSTNGVFSIGSGTSWESANPFTLNGNLGDLWLQPGLVNTDGDTQNWWYQTGSDGGSKYYVKNIVYGGQYANTTNPTSWLGNFYRDVQYQWFETRVKSNIFASAGPYGYTVTPSTQSQVWRGDLNGQNWTYMGFGSVTS